jgi:hypothetical protein
VASDEQLLRGDFANLAVFPDDHRQTTTTEFCALLECSATMRISTFLRQEVVGDAIPGVMNSIEEQQ